MMKGSGGIWVIHPKGRADLSHDAIMTVARPLGLIDVKSARFDEFYRRRSLGIGRFVTRDEIVPGAPGHGEGHNSGTPLNVLAAIATAYVQGMRYDDIRGGLLSFFPSASLTPGLVVTHHPPSPASSSNRRPHATDGNQTDHPTPQDHPSP